MKKLCRRLVGLLMVVGFMVTLIPSPLAGMVMANEGTNMESEAAPIITGYTQYTAETLDESKYYLIVSQDSKGNLYALYANPQGLEGGPGKLTQKGNVAARLSQNETTLSAVYVKDNSSLADIEESLHFTVEAYGSGYSFGSVSGYYLNLDHSMLAADKEEFTVQVLEGDYTIQQANSKRFLSFNVYQETTVNGKNNLYSDFATDFWGPVKKPETYKIYLYTKDGVTVQTDAAGKTESGQDIAESDPPSGITQEQPFAANTGGSANFRIPAMVTLSDGTIVAAADARWNHLGDACSIDIMVSRSKDGGKTWEYDLPIYFNDSTNAKHNYGACFIDPLMVRDHEDKIYLMVDLYPGGVAINTAPKAPHAASGFMEIEGKDRLVLYTSPNPDEQNDTNYAYYVGDYSDGDGLAGVYKVEGSDSYSPTPSYYLDRKFYLYDENKEKMYCQQLNNTDAVVHQNVFFYNADLHVRCATYLYLVTSEDKGISWSDPMLVNPQVRKDNQLDIFYGVGPGAGLCLEDGTIMLPCYTFKNQLASFIYSTDGGRKWIRSEDATPAGHWSSESCLVQIDDTTVRQFYRSGSNYLQYTDHTKQEDGSWKAGVPVTMENIPRRQNNQMSAIRYSKTYQGKPVIMVSTAANPNARQDGKIYVFTLEKDKSMKLVTAYDNDNNRTTTDTYAYSSITELKDGSIGLLYEGGEAPITYKKIPVNELAPELTFDE